MIINFNIQSKLCFSEAVVERKNVLYGLISRTTGFNPFKNEIIELAAVDNLGNEFNELIKPKSSISKKSQKLPESRVIW